MHYLLFLLEAHSSYMSLNALFKGCYVINKSFEEAKKHNVIWNANVLLQVD